MRSLQKSKIRQLIGGWDDFSVTISWVRFLVLVLVVAIVAQMKFEPTSSLWNAFSENSWSPDSRRCDFASLKLAARALCKKLYTHTNPVSSVRNVGWAANAMRKNLLTHQSSLSLSLKIAKFKIFYFRWAVSPKDSHFFVVNKMQASDDVSFVFFLICTVARARRKGILSANLRKTKWK